MTARTTTLACALGASLAVCGGSARADDIDNLGGKVIELDQRIVDLDAKLKPPLPPGPEIADRRLIDAQVLYELKNYEAASIILFDVVDKYPTSPAYPEALFYLADSLYLKRDFLSSRRFFEKIIDQGPQNPRYQESLQRLIELSLHTGDYSPVDGYIDKLDKMPPDQAAAVGAVRRGQVLLLPPAVSTRRWRRSRRSGPTTSTTSMRSTSSAPPTSPWAASTCPTRSWRSAPS